MGLKEVLRLSWIKFIIIIILLIVFYYGVYQSAVFGPTRPINWYIFATLFFIVLIYFVISLIVTIYLKYKK